MSDYMAATVTLPTWALALPAIADAIAAEDPDAVRAHTDGTTELSVESAAYGCLAVLKACLKRYGIAFDAHGDGRYEYDAVNRYFRPAEPGHPGVDSTVIASAWNNQPLVPLADLVRLQRATGRLSLRRIRSAMGLPPDSLAAWAAQHGPGLTETRLVRDNVAVALEDIGEGWDGDYRPDDPRDESLYRFTAYIQVDPGTGDPVDAGHAQPGDVAVWVPVPDASYCTQLPCTISDTIRIQATATLLDAFWDVLATHPAHSVKKLGEQLSWIAPGDFPETPGEGGAA